MIQVTMTQARLQRMSSLH